MGTSTSHPSPKGSSPGAPEWKEAKEAIKEGANPRQIVNRVLDAFNAQYGESTRDTLIDAGVKKVAEVLTQKLTATTNRNEMLVIGFITEARKQLALNNCNSLFAELALSSGSKAILQGGAHPEREFAADFATKIVDYVVSRDLPSTLGSVGLANLESVKTLLGSVSHDFHNQANSSTETAPIEILKEVLRRR